MLSSKPPCLNCGSSNNSRSRSPSSLWSVVHLYFTCLFSLFGTSDSFSPNPRYAHSALLINGSIYFVGGQVYNTTYQAILPSKDFFYLDVSKAFNTSLLPWTDLSNLSGLTESSWTAVAAGGPKHDQLFLIGGVIWNVSNPLVFMFDTQDQSWSTPAISEPPPSRRREFTAVSDETSKIFCFGGLADKATTDNPNVNTTFSNEMVVLDTTEMSWVMKSTIGAPLPQADSAATLLPNEQILYVGGRQANGEFASMTEIWLYDTKSLMWSSMTTTGVTPPGRYGHSAVLTSDGRLILHGGISINSTEPNSDIYVLNTMVSPYAWSRPQFDNGVTPRAFHTATMVNNYMIVAFGVELDSEPSSTIYILDADNPTNYTWVTSFNPVRTSTLNNEIISGTKTDSTRLIVAVVGGAFGVTLIGVFGLLYYRRRQRKSIERNSGAPSTHPLNNSNNPNIVEVTSPPNFSNYSNSNVPHQNVHDSLISSDTTITPHTTPPTSPTSERVINRGNRFSLPITPQRSHTVSEGSGGRGISEDTTYYYTPIQPQVPSSSPSSSLRVKRHRFSLPVTTRPPNSTTRFPISSDEVDQTERASDQPENFVVTREVQTITVPRQSLYVVNPDLNRDSNDGKST